MRTSLMIQVRLNSTRLPGKALMQIGGRTVISYALETLSKVDVDDYVIVTTEDSAAALADEAARYGFDIFIGSESDVLQRYALAVKKYNSDIVIRATGDNPYVSGLLAQQLLADFKGRLPDYAAYHGNPIGTGVEIVLAKSLLEADVKATEPYHREHVNPFLYQNPDKYTIYTPTVGQEFYMPQLRITMDTQSDFDFIQGLIMDSECGFPAEADRIISFCRARGYCG